MLPCFRSIGAAPINWAVINGDTETGITTFFLKHEIDTGEVIQQVRVPIADTDNVGIVHDKLMLLGGDLVLETVDAILEWYKSYSSGRNGRSWASCVRHRKSSKILVVLTGTAR